MRQVLLLALLLTSLLANAQTRTRTIAGRVLFDDLSPGYEATIWVYDTLQLGTSGLNGDFTIELPTNADKMVIRMLGMETASVKLPQDCSRLEVVMIPDVIYHYRSHQKVDRRRKRSFDNIPELHSNAFAKGLFTTPTPCYTREFKRAKPQLDEIRRELRMERDRIKTLFGKLEIGDTIQVPFSGTYRSDGTDRTTLTPWAYFTDETQFPCLIEGIVTDKHRQRPGYTIEIKITDCNSCTYDTPIIYQGKDMAIGTVFRHDMRMLKVLTK